MSLRLGITRQSQLYRSFASPSLLGQSSAGWTARKYSSAAPTSASDSTADPTAAGALLTTTPRDQPVPDAFRVNAALVLNRPPQITRDLTPFEESYFLYQRRLNERTSLQFHRFFYYKDRTPAYLDFKRKTLKRETPAKDIGKYSGYGEKDWNDELLVGATESKTSEQVKEIIADAENLAVTVKEIGQTNLKEKQVNLMPRETEADAANDQTSLDRRLQEHVYLLVENEKGEWEFPVRTLEPWEDLRQAAERVIPEIGGAQIHTWMVGNGPVGHLKRQTPPTVNPKTGSTEVGDKTFFMKGRIMAGTVALAAENGLGARSFRWLTRGEIKGVVSPAYWDSIRRFLVAPE